ncbi:BRO-N domain-containing protein, partial [Salmonella enterica]
WFAANEVCEVLGFANPRDAVARHVDDDDVGKHDTLTAGGRQRTTHINESGMYALIFGSTKPEAKRFKRWVTSEVLPSIRRTGGYTAPTA